MLEKQHLSKYAITQSANEPEHDQIMEMMCAPAKTQTSLGICPVCSFFTVHYMGG